MRFLADESCDFAIVHALRSEGHEVHTVADTNEGAEDDEVLRMADRLGAILLAEDKDFGQLIFARHQSSFGVISLRYPHALRHYIADAVVEFVRSRGEQLYYKYVVVQPGSVRISPLPKA